MTPTISALYRSACWCLPFFALLLLPLLASAVPAERAQEEEVWEQLPAAARTPRTPKIELPDPRDRSAKVLLNQETAEHFQDQLLSPLASWVESGLFVSRMFKSLDFAWQRSESDEEATLKNIGRYTLQEDGTLARKGEAQVRSGLPFGKARDLDLEEDPRRKAYKILWNMTAAEGAAGSILYDIRLNWFGVQTAARESEGLFYRRYFPEDLAQALPSAASAPAVIQAAEDQPPAALPAASPLAPAVAAPGAPEAALQTQNGKVFRQEVLQLLSPPVVFGFAQLSWRYQDNREDQGWIYSPVIGKSRRVLSANRSDSLLGGQLTFDDLFVWSTKIQAVEAHVVAEKTLLVPFPALSSYIADYDTAPALGALVGAHDGSPSPEAAGKKGAGERLPAVAGFYQGPAGGRATVLWNAESKQYAAQAAWVPATSVLVPRPVWIIEMAPREPLYSAGREVLVVDKESMLPVYKLAYDHLGQLKRTVIGAWAHAAAKDGGLRFPFCAFVLAIGEEGRDAMALSTRSVYLVDAQNTSLARSVNSLLDVATHGRDVKSKENGAKEELPAAAPEAAAAPPSPSPSSSALPQPED